MTALPERTHPAAPDITGHGTAAHWARLDAATAQLPTPFLVLDHAALLANADDLVRRASGMPIRVASKSLRSREILREILARPGFAGVLAFTVAEALWLAEEHDDVVVAYPSADRSALAALAGSATARSRVTVMVDDVAQLDLIRAAGATAARPVRIAVDLDASDRIPMLPRLGVFRSPLRTEADVARFAAEIRSRPELRLVGAMSYEAQIAGVADDPRGKPLHRVLIAAMRRHSLADLRERRAAAISVLRVSAADPDTFFVNGGGTGSLELTRRDPAITELAAGSGLFGPTLFDRYRAFRPAPAIAFPADVVRAPAPGIVTVLGGGWPASGPAAPDRLPTPVWPPGLRFVGSEGAGEVQTPLRGAQGLGVGDRVWFRPAKAGEITERVNVIHVVDGDRVSATIPTYRGEGKAFL